MSTNYPGAIDTFTNPTPTSDTAVVSHASQHANINDSVAAIEAKVGANSSAVQTSHDFKLSLVTTTDKATPRDAAATVTNKTLSTGTKILLGSDATGDTYYNGGSGTTARVGIGSVGQVYTSNGSSPTWSSPSGTNVNYVVDTGAANAYIATLSPALGAYTAGVLVQFKAVNANTTISTVNVNGLGVKTIKKLGGVTDLASGDIAAGQIVELEYDGTNFQMISPSALTLNSNGNGSALTNLPNTTTYKQGIDATRQGNAAASTQNIAHGLGVVPKKVKLNVMFSSNPAGAAVGYVSTSIGSYNGAVNSCVYSELHTSSGNGINANSSTIYGIYLLENTSGGNIYQRAIITTDSTNIILTWTINSLLAAQPINIMWEAEA